MIQLWIFSTNWATMEYGVFSPSSPMPWSPTASCNTCTPGLPPQFPPWLTVAFASPGPSQMLHFQGSSLQPIPPPSATTLSDHIIHLWKDWAWPLHSSVFPNYSQAVANAIHLGMAHGVCDGSYMSEALPDFATTAWLLEDSHLPHNYPCLCPTL